MHHVGKAFFATLHHTSIAETMAPMPFTNLQHTCIISLTLYYNSLNLVSPITFVQLHHHHCSSTTALEQLHRSSHRLLLAAQLPMEKSVRANPKFGERKCIAMCQHLIGSQRVKANQLVKLWSNSGQYCKNG